MTEDEFKNLHSKARLELSEHIETCLRRLPEVFPGFQFETLVGTEGWGAKISRDDVAPASGKGLMRVYSRLEMVIRPYSASHIVELVARGAIRNKEVLSRSHFQMLAQFDQESFGELIDQWVLEFAEKYSARA